MSDAHNQEERLILNELHHSKAVGTKLGVAFEFTDEMIMKEMIEIEAKEYSLLQRNSSTC